MVCLDAIEEGIVRPRRDGGNSCRRILKLVIAVHELIHAGGLSNGDHSQFPDVDVFHGFPSISVGTTAKDDRITLSQKKLPPIFVVASTVSKIKALW